jgi:hypothetical protein
MKRVTESLYSLGLCDNILSDKEQRSQIANLIYGLVGAGTNRFTEQGGKKYRKDLSSAYINMLAELTGKIEKRKSVKIDYANLTVGQSISEWQLNNENPDMNSFDDNFIRLHEKICQSYDVSTQQFIEKVKNMESNTRFVGEFMGDMQRLDNLVLQLRECEIKQLTPFIEKFEKIQAVWEAYKLQGLTIGV